ncbi:MAG: LPP20 family lipoprotein [Nitrospirae bacterium]|nr:LPP20 family lipoprotein [Nitrospirota bacterium]
MERTHVVRRAALFAIAALTVGLAGASPVLARGTPDWVESGTSKKYPPEKYFIGVGNAPDLGTAQDKARAEIAKILRARVEQEQSEKETYRQQTTGKKTQASQTFEASTATRVKIDETLEGVAIAETFEEKSMRYALAVLDREKTAMDLRKKVTTLELEAEELMKGAGADAAKIQKARSLYGAWERYEKADGYARQLAVVSPTGSGISLHGGEARIRAEKALADIKFRVEVKGEGLEDVVKAITQALSGLGFTGAAEGEKEDLLVRGDVALEPYDRGSSLKFAKWSLALQCVESAGGEAIATVSKVGDEGSTTPDLARQKAIVNMRRMVQEQLRDELLRSLLGAKLEPK